MFAEDSRLKIGFCVSPTIRSTQFLKFRPFTFKWGDKIFCCHFRLSSARGFVIAMLPFMNHVIVGERQTQFFYPSEQYTAIFVFSRGHYCMYKVDQWKITLLFRLLPTNKKGKMTQPRQVRIFWTFFLKPTKRAEVSMRKSWYPTRSSFSLLVKIHPLLPFNEVPCSCGKRNLASSNTRTNLSQAGNTKRQYLGIQCTKWTIIVVSLYALHRNPEYWEESETFNPDRFLKPGKKIEFCSIIYKYPLQCI